MEVVSDHMQVGSDNNTCQINNDTACEFFDYFCIEKSADNVDLLRTACSYWDLSDRDLETAMRMADRYHRTELVSVRRMLGIYISEWMAPFDDCFRHRMLYYNVPGTITFMYFIKALMSGSACEEKQSEMQERSARSTSESAEGGHIDLIDLTSAYVGSPDFISMVVMYGLFDKSERIETGSCRHCAVNLMRAALAEDPRYPSADARISFGFTCDEAPKQDVAIAEFEQNALRVFITSPVRGRNTPEFIESRLRETLTLLQNKFAIAEVATQQMEEVYRRCKSDRFRLAVKVHQIIDLVNKSGSFVVTNNDITFLESLLITSFQCGMRELEEILTEMFAEIKNCDSTGVGSVDHRFCVYYTPICNPAYGDIMERNGIALLDHTAFSNRAIYTGKKDPCEDAALEAMGMLIAGSAVDEGEKIAEILRRKKLDGMISGMFTFDRWMGMQQHQLQTIIEDKTGKTVFIYDTDFWNQESFPEDRMETAVETLKCMLDSKA